MNHKTKNVLIRLIAVSIPFVFLLLIEAVGHYLYYRSHEKTFLWETTTQGGSGFTWMDRFGTLWFKPNSIIRLHHYKNYTADLGTDKYGLIHNGVAEREVSESAINIVFVGGSTVEGRGSSSNAMTIPARTEACLRQASDKEIDVYNMGYSGDNTFNEDLRIRTRSLEFKPALIISLNGRNDYHSLISNGAVYENGHPGVVHVDQIYNTGPTMVNAAKMLDGALRTKSIIYKSLTKLFEPEEAVYLNAHTVNSLERGRDNYLADLKASATYLRLMGIRHVAFFQPTLAYKKPMTELEKRLIEKYEQQVHGPVNYFDSLRRYYALMEQVESDQHLSFFNLSGLFAARADALYVDSVHYNDKGNDLIADQVCRVLLQEHADLF